MQRVDYIIISLWLVSLFSHDHRMRVSLKWNYRWLTVKGDISDCRKFERNSHKGVWNALNVWHVSAMHECVNEKHNFWRFFLKLLISAKNHVFVFDNEVSEVWHCIRFVFIRLHFVFHQPLLHALDLIDRKNITKLTTPSGRVLYQVSKRR